MARSTLSKAARVGRATVFLVGLAVVLALVAGAASMAFAANGSNFVLGVLNNTATAVTKLTGNVDGPALQVVNNKDGAGDTALDLRVQAGEAPMRVNSATKVINLNADKLDNRDSSAFAPRSQFEATQVIKDEGPLPLSGTFTSHGGMLLVSANGSGFRSSANAQFQGNIGMWVSVLDSSGVGEGHRMRVHTNERNSHKVFVSEPWVINDLPAGTYTVTLEAAYEELRCNNGLETDETYCTTTDQNDPFYVTVVELPK